MRRNSAIRSSATPPAPTCCRADLPRDGSLLPLPGAIGSPAVNLNYRRSLIRWRRINSPICPTQTSCSTNPPTPQTSISPAALPAPRRRAAAAPIRAERRRRRARSSCAIGWRAISGRRCHGCSRQRSCCSLRIGQRLTALLIARCCVLNVILGAVQESRADAALALLKQRLSLKSRVKRDGVWVDLPAADTRSRRHRASLAG